MPNKLKILIGLSGLVLVIAGCRGVAQQNGSASSETVEAAQKGTPVNRAASLPANLSEIPQPVNDLAEGDYAWNQLLPRDGIRPIYEDEVEFVGVEQAPYEDDELVIGVAINGEAKAYAIGPLNNREMVNDTVGGVPILVTW